MNYSEFKKERVSIISRQSGEDILFANNTIQDFLDKLLEYHKKDKLDEVHIVYVESDIVTAIIELSNLVKSIEFIQEFDPSDRQSKKLRDVNLAVKFPVNECHTIQENATVGDVIKIFKDRNKPTNTITVLNNAGAYMGKINRSYLVEAVAKLGS